MPSKKLSIVVPVFNPPIERLQCCIDSIYSQDGLDFELILVDDGSVPEIAALLDGFASDHEDTLVIHQSNKGVSCARNVGTARACGDYLFYVDCDDEIVPGCIVEGIEAAEKTNADIVYGYVLRDPERNSDQECLADCDGSAVELSLDELMAYHLKGTGSNVDLCPKKGILNVKVGPIARFVKRDLAVKVPFPLGVPISEDTIWNVGLLLKAKRAVVVRSAWYLYWRTEGSAVSRFRCECDEEAVLAMKALGGELGSEAMARFFAGYVERGVGELNRVARMYSRSECTLSGHEKRIKLANAYDAIFGEWNLKELLGACPDASSALKLLLCKTGLSLPLFKALNENRAI